MTLDLPAPWRAVSPPKPIRCTIPGGARPVVDAAIIGLHENETNAFPILVVVQEGADFRRYSIRLSDIEQA